MSVSYSSLGSTLKRATADHQPRSDGSQARLVVGQRASVVGLLVIVCTFVGLSALYSALVPLAEGPDEPGHASYVFFLARTGRLPDQRTNDVPGEGHQPPLAYVLAAPLVAWLPSNERVFDQPANPHFTWAGGGELNAVAHGSREYWPWQGATLAWHLARLASVLCGAATVVCTYFAVQTLVANRRRTVERRIDSDFVVNSASFVPFMAAGLVALNPQFLFTSALVTNDALLAALSAAILWLVLRRYAAGSYVRYALALGTLTGLALLTKQSALILLPIAGVAVFEHSWRNAGRAWHKQQLAALALFGGTTLLVCGWWFWRNLQLYGDLFGLAVFQAEFATQAFNARSLAAWFGALRQLHSSFWGRFGWMNVPMPAWALGVFSLIELAALAGGLRAMLRKPGTVAWFWAYWPLIALPLLAGVWVLSFALTAGLVAWQGRLLFPALPSIAIVLACGLAGWQTRAQGNDHQHRLTSRAGFLLLGVLLLVALWLPFGVIRPAYTFYTLPAATAQARLGEATYARLGKPGDPGAELLGWQLAQPLHAGGQAELRLMWHARGRQNRDWTVFIHLADTSDTIVAEDNTQPHAGRFPMTQWVAGDWVEDTHTLHIPATVPPGEYELRVGLFDAVTNERAAVYSPRGRLMGDYHVLATVRVD
jgi:4-amino-4-deoxy-L-arabinose transferase-like glycosyltransferase